MLAHPTTRVYMTCPQQPYHQLLAKPGIEGYFGSVGLGAVVGSELGRWDASAAAVGPDLVVVPTPLADDVAGLGQ